MGVNSTLTVNDGDLVADGVQIYSGQEVTLTLTAVAIGEDLNISVANFINPRLIYNFEGSTVSIPITVTWTLDPSGDTNEDGVWSEGEERVWTAQYTIPEGIPEGATAIFRTTFETKDLGDEFEPEGNVESSSTRTGGTITVVSEPAPALTLEKTADVESFELFGDAIEYTFAVTNTGNRDLTGLTVTDPLIENISAVLGEGSNNIGDIDLDGVFDIEETWLFKGTYLAQEQDLNLDGTAIPNTATAEAFYGTQAVNDDDDETVAYDEVILGIDLTKTADQASYEGADEEIVYTFSVANTGNRGLSDVTVTDPLLTNVAAVTAEGTSFNVGDADQDNTLDTDETWTFTGSLITTEANTDDILNTATASGSYRDREATDTDDVTVTYDRPILSMALVKEADRETFEAVGESILYTFTVTNTGNRDLDAPTISDSLLNNDVSAILAEGSAFNVGDIDADGLFDIDEAWKFSGAYTTTEADAVTGKVVNVAQASATYKGGNVLSNEDDAIVNYNPPEPPPTFEGLSLGYWSEHIKGRKADATWNEEAYEGASYKDASFEVFFFGGQVGSLNWGSNRTDVKMSEAVKLNGGGQFALARDAVAAVLNAERDDVNYKYTVAEVQSMVRDAFNINDGGANTWGIEGLKNELSLNNNLGNDLV